MLGSIVFFITATHFLLALVHFVFFRSYAILMGAWSLYFFCHCASMSSVALTGDGGFMGFGVVMISSTSPQTKARSTFLIHSPYLSPLRVRMWLMNPIKFIPAENFKNSENIITTIACNNSNVGQNRTYNCLCN